VSRSRDNGEIAEVVAIVAALFLERGDAEDDDVVEAAVAAGIDRLRAEIAVAFVPCAFGRALIREARWTDALPDKFQAMDRRGRYVPFRLSENETYRAAAQLAEHQRIAHRPPFAAVAGRSAEVHAIRKMSAGGSDVRGAVFSPVILGRLSAEDIPQRRLRWWHRVTRGGRS
jgi:hypothetical protein